MSALCYWFHYLTCHAPTGVDYIFLGVITSWLVCCPVRVPRTVCLCLALRGELAYLAPDVFLVDFPVFWLPAQRSVMVPQLSLSTVLA